ncbi:MAG: glycoside hydrolase family 127 protein [Phycisphaerae bacterium]|nr:glycoside hydrolase family 127 protein [Phycisphaerae bacterium]
MKASQLSCLTAAVLFSCLVATADDTGANLAPIAKASTSHVSGDCSLEALRDESFPKTSHVRGKGSYGNWPHKRTQWVQYDWTCPVRVKKIDVFWWDDHRGVRLPKACRVLYWDGGKFTPVSNPKGLGVEKDKLNTTTFDEVKTSKLRLEIDGNGSYSTGILEWKAYNVGPMPDFPPAVIAGVDRVVMCGGKTYLSGKMQAIGGKDAAKSVWSKGSGPGEVKFADAGKLETTATFSAPGVYTLKLTGTKGKLTDTSTLTVRAVTPPPADQLTLIDTKSYKIDSPLWSGRAKALIVNWIPHCIKMIDDPDLKQGGINNFLDAANKLAGKPHKKHRGYVFSNAWIYNTIESICLAMMVDPAGDKEIIAAQKAMKKTLEDWIPKVLAAQEKDGYIQTFYTLNDHKHWDPKLRSAHEGYVAGYFLEAAVGHYMMTDRKYARLYNAAKRLADCWDRNVGPAPKKPWYCGHQAMEMGLVRFGRFVNKIEGKPKGDRYIKLGKYLLDARQGGHKYDQSHVPVTQQYEAVGHAVRASYSYAGMSDVAMETGDVDYQSAVMSIWDNIVNRKYYVTGGIGSGETSEGFGPDYSLRHNAYCESCSSCGEIFFQHKLHLAYHDSKYADLYEETLYNALLGSIDLPGKNFYYQNPLTQNNDRYPWHGCPCCIGNIPRVLLMLPTWMYAKNADSIYVNTFIGSTVKIEEFGEMEVEMVQATDYPWSGEVAITVNPAKSKEFSVRVRLPKRDVSELYSATPKADGITSIRVNGAKIKPKIEKGYAVITRTWKKGDKIDLVLPMKVQRVKGSDKIAATRGQIALRYGPLMYAAEGVDQDIKGTISPNTPLTLEWKGDLLGGVMIMKGWWRDGKRFTAIPYYARNNRNAKAPKGRSKTSMIWIKDE